MKPLITITDATGTEYSCDATCYRDHHVNMHCPCAGHNRGIGYQTARAQTIQNWQHYIEIWAKSHPRLQIALIDLTGLALTDDVAPPRPPT